MLLWIIIAILAYVGIGAGLLFWACKDPWGGLVLEVWPLIVFFWPVLAVRSLLSWVGIK